MATRGATAQMKEKRGGGDGRQGEGLHPDVGRGVGGGEGGSRSGCCTFYTAKVFVFSCSEQINEYLTECEYISFLFFFFKHRCLWEAAKERG